MRCLFLFVILLVPVCASATVDVENTNAEAFTLSCNLFMRYTVYGELNVIPDEAFSLRRASLSAEFTLSDNLDGELQIETRPTEIYLKDCFLNWEPANWAGLKAGQFKKPFGLNTLTSSWNLLTLDHSLVHWMATDLNYSGRDLGLEVTLSPSGQYLPVLTVGVFNGSALGIEKDNNENQYVARCLFSLPGGIELGGGLSSIRLGEPDPAVPSGYSSSTRQWCKGADISFAGNVTNDLEILAVAEYVKGPNWMLVDVIAGEEAPDFSSFWASIGGVWRLRNVPGLRSLEAYLSYDTIRPESDDAEETLISPIIGVWFSRSIRVRFGACIHTFENMFAMEDYTDYILEAAVNF